MQRRRGLKKLGSRKLQFSDNGKVMGAQNFNFAPNFANSVGFPAQKFVHLKQNL